MEGIPSPEVTWYLQNSKLPDKQNFPDYDVTASRELLLPAAAWSSNSFLCNCTNPLDSVANFARGKFFEMLCPYLYGIKADLNWSCGIVLHKVTMTTERWSGEGLKEWHRQFWKCGDWFGCVKRSFVIGWKTSCHLISQSEVAAVNWREARFTARGARYMPSLRFWLVACIVCAFCDFCVCFT